MNDVLRVWEWPGRFVSLTSRTITATGDLLALVPRVVVLVGEAETLLQRVSGVVTGVERMMTAVEAVVESVQTTQQRAMAQIDRMAGVATVASHTADRASALVDDYLPSLDRLRPIVERLARTTDAHEVESIVALVDLMPTVVKRLDTDILPVLDTLGTVAPDLRDLLNLSRELNEMLSSIPGLGWIRNRSEKRDPAELTAAEEPPERPDRRES